MARTKGAKDKRPRKKPALSMTPNAIRKRQAAQRARADAEASGRPETPAPKPTDRKAEPRSVDEFNAAIDAELKQTSDSFPSQDRPADGADRVGTSQQAPAGPLEDEALLTRSAWEGVCRVPFRTLGLVLCTLGVIDRDGQTAIGNLAKKRAPDLARPSYVIFDHYARRYASMNPDDPVSLAIVATGLVAADIAEELAEIIVVDRAMVRRRREQQTERAAGTAADVEKQG